MGPALKQASSQLRSQADAFLRDSSARNAFIEFTFSHGHQSRPVIA